MASLGKCTKCGKTCYQNEGHRVGPPGKEIVFHRGCFKCENPGCSWQLTLTSYRFCDGKIWCKNHEPMRGFSNPDHLRGTVSSDAVLISNATNAPKLGVVNEQIRGSGDRNAQVADMATSNALKAPKREVINEQIRGSGEKNSQVPDLATRNALNAPKPSTPVNEQIRPGGRNAQNFV